MKEFDVFFNGDVTPVRHFDDALNMGGNDERRIVFVVDTDVLL